jgi:hypothetical protein
VCDEGKWFDEGLRVVAVGCTQLRSLDFANNESVTDEGLRAVGAFSAQLRSLTFGGSDSMTDARLRSVVPACAQLTSLSLRGCYAVTDAGLQAVATASSQLKELDLWSEPPVQLPPSSYTGMMGAGTCTWCCSPHPPNPAECTRTRHISRPVREGQKGRSVSDTQNKTSAASWENLIVRHQQYYVWLASAAGNRGKRR